MSELSDPSLRMLTILTRATRSCSMAGSPMTPWTVAISEAQSFTRSRRGCPASIYQLRTSAEHCCIWLLELDGATSGMGRERKYQPFQPGSAFAPKVDVKFQVQKPRSIGAIEPKPSYQRPSSAEVSSGGVDPSQESQQFSAKRTQVPFRFS